MPPFDENPRDRPSDDEETMFPTDRPLASHDRTTAQELREGESLNTRVAREIPDDQPETDEEGVAGRLVEQTVDGHDVTRELEADESDDRAGLSAEEAAVHVHDADETQPDEPSTDEALGRGADRGA